MSNLLFFKDLDSHYEICLCGIRLSLRHKSRLHYKPAQNTGIDKNSGRNPGIIVSLTSFPARINMVHETIDTLLEQTLKPDKIVLWLTKNQFPNGDKDLPSNLLRQKKFGLEIEYYEENIKSYTKLLPSLQKYPNDIIITVDDDAYYLPNLVESLYKAYLNNQKNIYTRRSVKLEFKDNKISPVSPRKYGYKHLPNASYLNQLMGCSGVLYPPHSLYKDITNTEIIKETVPTHDDVYFWAMALLNHTKIQVVGGFDEDLYFIEEAQAFSLKNINKKGQSGISLEDAAQTMINKYPQILKVLKEEQQQKQS
ncbi:MAG: hypothetical protein SPL70_03260 [Cyanobacteriota bacterium]|nr:hypothetical protein [Cyanobacteriota bacterium]MDY6382905.1 hypothetical protein [Cyanobacteriota bacterium]